MKIIRAFKNFLNRLFYLIDISIARRQIKQGKGIPQEKLFKELGL